MRPLPEAEQYDHTVKGAGAEAPGPIEQHVLRRVHLRSF
jgi:hypothetical protein